jgi:apolipoprotein N-acyltransferase
VSVAQTSRARAEEGLVPLAGVAGFVAGLSGVAAAILAALLGALASLGQAPYHLWPLTMAALTLFVWQVDGAAVQRRRVSAGFWRAYCFGFGYFLAGLWWVGSAFLVDADQYGFLAPFAVAALPTGLALFWGVAGAFSTWLWRRDWRRVAVLTTAIFIVEYARGHVLTGFPWNLFGQIWPAGGAISQTASVVGVYGLTLITLFGFMTPATIAAPSKRFTMSVMPPIIAAGVFLAMLGGGELRLLTAGQSKDSGVHLRIVQAQIGQAEKWAPENRDKVIEHYLRLSAAPGLQTRTHIIWGEAALPLRLLDEPRLLDSIARSLGDGKVLLTGIVRRDLSDPLRPSYYNSFAAIPIQRGSVDPSQISIYDKVKLVPFGEYVPLFSLAERIAPKTALAFANAFTPGPGKATLNIPGAPPVAPQICYEAIFPGFTPRGGERPGWIVNVTNDSWFQGTPGPHQLYNQARYRAIEEGVPLARAASGGFSAVIDPYGRAIATIPADADNVVDAPLPSALRPPLYSLLGDAPAYILMAACLFVGLSRRRGRA